MSSEVQRGKKRGKAQYVSNAKRHRGGRQLEAGMEGILITCNMNERKCVGKPTVCSTSTETCCTARRRVSFLSYIFWYLQEVLCDKEDRLSGSEEEEDDDDDDVEAALKKEVDQIRTSTEKNLRRFQSVESGANNVVFIRTLNIPSVTGAEPEKLVHHILKDLNTTKKKKTRVILRMLPVTGTCKAFPEDLKKYTEMFFHPWFKAPNKGTFQIVYKARNNNHMNREEVIKDLAAVQIRTTDTVQTLESMNEEYVGCYNFPISREHEKRQYERVVVDRDKLAFNQTGLVGNLNPENKVDLTNPEFTIVVEIIRNVCCLSVVKDYTLLRKYNLQEVVKSAKEEKPQEPAGDAGKEKTEEQSNEDPAVV
ncbi:unnamed protein product [Ranitomeya imitator]|uniref:THUMP domain-containing protein n=1 Tax=Ranitomeya imitator TaxID=111125 RepID=A0ABN9LK07_9NEOB|nr:unnamed protein product [Ranitomeya imitator]